jgi:uncharacterized integral membrane protein
MTPHGIFVLGSALTTWLFVAFLGVAPLSRYNKAGIGFLLGLVLGPIGVVFAFTMASHARKKEEERRHAEILSAIGALGSPAASGENLAGGTKAG